MGRTAIQSQPREKVSEPHLNKTSQMWWHMPVIPAIWNSIDRKILVQG
jgi:hypothetical protein